MFTPGGFEKSTPGWAVAHANAFRAAPSAASANAASWGRQTRAATAIAAAKSPVAHVPFHGSWPVPTTTLTVVSSCGMTKPGKRSLVCLW